MIDTSAIALDKEVYCFELDDVLYPRRDYMLQVYYLFAQFVAFSEGVSSASDMVAFMKDVYVSRGEGEVFPMAQKRFGLDQKYEENLRRLQANAQLPLKLIPFEEVTRFLEILFRKQKKIAILTKGNPIEQLNKIRHIAWGELDAYRNSLKIYFIDELEYQNYVPVEYIAKDYDVNENQVKVIDKW